MLNKILLSLIGLIFIGVIAGTAIALFKKNAKPGEGLEKIYDRPIDASKGKYGKDVQYNLIGKMWIPLKTEKNENAVTLIVSPWFEYKEDRAFYEEMDRKHANLKKITFNYFSSMSMKEIKSRDEKLIKEELVRRINEILILGKIDKVLFNDFQFLEE